MTKPSSPPGQSSPPGHENDVPDWIHDPNYALVGFVPCVPYEGPDGDVEEGILKSTAKRMAGVRLLLQDDETLLVETLDGVKRQVFPKGLAAFLFERKRTTEPGP